MGALALAGAEHVGGGHLARRPGWHQAVHLQAGGFQRVDLGFQPALADGGHQDIGAARQARQIPGARMGHGDGGVGR